MSYASHDDAVTHDIYEPHVDGPGGVECEAPGPCTGPLPMPGPIESDGDRLARSIRNEVGRTFYATGGERISGDQAFAQIMTRASAAKRGA